MRMMISSMIPQPRPPLKIPPIPLLKAPQALLLFTHTIIFLSFIKFLAAAATIVVAITVVIATAKDAGKEF